MPEKGLIEWFKEQLEEDEERGMLTRIADLWKGVGESLSDVPAAVEEAGLARIPKGGSLREQLDPRIGERFGADLRLVGDLLSPLAGVMGTTVGEPAKSLAYQIDKPTVTAGGAELGVGPTELDPDAFARTTGLLSEMATFSGPVFGAVGAAGKAQRAREAERLARAGMKATRVKRGIPHGWKGFADDVNTGRIKTGRPPRPPRPDRAPGPTIKDPSPEEVAAAHERLTEAANRKHRALAKAEKANEASKRTHQKRRGQGMPEDPSAPVPKGGPKGIPRLGQKADQLVDKPKKKATLDDALEPLKGEEGAIRLGKHVATTKSGHKVSGGVWDEGVGLHEITTNKGRKLHVSITDRGRGAIEVDWVGLPDEEYMLMVDPVNEVGTRGMREILGEIRKQYPAAERVSFGRLGKPMGFKNRGFIRERLLRPLRGEEGAVDPSKFLGDEAFEVVEEFDDIKGAMEVMDLDHSNLLLQDELQYRLSQTAQFFRRHTEGIAEAGMRGIPKEARRGQTTAEQIAGTYPSTSKIFDTKISPQYAEADMAQIVGLDTHLSHMEVQLGKLQKSGAHSRVSHFASHLQDEITKTRKLFDEAANNLKEGRAAWAHTGHVYQRGLPPSVIERLIDHGHDAGQLKRTTLGRGIYDQLWAGIKKYQKQGWKSSDANIFLNNLVDAVRFNLFSVFSAGLDVIGNTAEIGAQGVGLIGEDAFRLLFKGEFTDLASGAFVKALARRGRLRFQNLGEYEKLIGGRTFTGEKITSGGLFLDRTTRFRHVMDSALALPIRTKAGVDTMAKRLMFTTEALMDARRAATKAGLRHGADRTAFIENFMQNLPRETLAKAVDSANKAGFRRTLTPWQEAVSTSWAVKAAIPFPRWVFQFGRASAEWLGASGSMYTKMRNGTVKGEDFARWAGKTLAGWGGIYYMDSALYEQVDFTKMEYVTEDGNRIRLAGRDPIPTALMLSAMARGDTENALNAARYSTLGFLAESGLIGGMWRAALGDPGRGNQPARRAREINRIIEKLIPGQAVMKAMKSLTDPVRYEGPLRAIPGAAQATGTPQVDPTTGEPYVQEQSFMGVDVTRPGGAGPIPGATLEMNDVEAALNKFAQSKWHYPPPREFLDGKKFIEMDQRTQNVYWTHLGKARQQFVDPIAKQMRAAGMLGPDAFRGDYDGRERMRAIFMERENEAVRIAWRNTQAELGVQAMKLRRQPTAKERALPGGMERSETARKRRRLRKRKRKRRYQL